MKSAAMKSNVHHLVDHADKPEGNNGGREQDQGIKQVLTAAYELLEEYGPVWYTAALSQMIREKLGA